MTPFTIASMKNLAKMKLEKNYTSCLVLFATFVHSDPKRLPLSLIDQRNRGVKCSDVEFVTEENMTCYFQEITRNLKCMSATAKQHRQVIQAWLHVFEPKRSFVLVKLVDVERSIKLQKKTVTIVYQED